MEKRILLLFLLPWASLYAPAQPAGGQGGLPEGAFGFDYFERHLYLDLNFNDTVPGQWIFDTGAVNLYPDSTEFAGYPFWARSKRRFKGAGQDIVTLDVVLDTVTVGNGIVSLESPMAAILDLKKILGQKPSGIVGNDLFRETAVEINYSDFYMRPVDRSDLPPRGYTEISLTVHSIGILLIPLKFRLQSGEEFEGRFVYDTGSGGMLSINSPTAERWGLEEKVSKKIEQHIGDIGIGGQARQKLFRALSITLGGHEIKMPLADYSLNTEGVSSSEEFDGIAGNLLLEQFDHILDMPAKRLYLRPGRFFGREFRERVSGFNCIDRRDIADGFIILSLDVGGAAERAGLRMATWLPI